MAGHLGFALFKEVNTAFFEVCVKGGGKDKIK